MSKFKLTNPIEFKAPSHSKIFVARNLLSKYQWFGLILTILIVSFSFYKFGKWRQRRLDQKEQDRNKYLSINNSND